VHLIVPYTTVEADPVHGGGRVYPPLALITVDWRSGRVVQYVNLRLFNPWPTADWETQVGTFPHPAVAQLSRAEYRQQVTALLTMYDEMLDTLALNGALPPFWMAQFSALLRQLLEPSLEPYYRALAPKFFERLLGPAVTA
jgi:hypothetical protein